MRINLICNDLFEALKNSQKHLHFSKIHRLDIWLVCLPNTAIAQELLNACAAHGGKAWDHSAMVRALEKMANFEIDQNIGATK